MYKSKYIFGKMVEYQGTKRKITGMKFAYDGVWYKLSGLKDWVRECDIAGQNTSK